MIELRIFMKPNGKWHTAIFGIENVREAETNNQDAAMLEAIKMIERERIRNERANYYR